MRVEGFPGLLGGATTPLKPGGPSRTFPAVDDEHDVEVFERIPWESLEQPPDRRWMAYLLAAAIILGAVGVSFGRQMGRETQPGPTTSNATVGATRRDHTPAPTVEATAVPELLTTWSEADLMALPADSLDAAAAATAEWYVVDFFTRDEPAGDRSFVEWVRASQVEWRSPSTAEVTVLIRRLAAVGDEPYQRLEAEAWRITTELADGGWAVVPGPVRQETPELVVLPDPGAAQSEAEWTDPAGVVWRVRPPPEEG